VSDTQRIDWLSLRAERNGAGVSTDRVVRFAAPLAALLVGLLIRYLAVLVTRTEQAPEAALRALCMWDCDWYIYIAERGYNPFPNVPGMIDHGNWAFFPVLPLLVGLATRVLPFLPTVIVGSLISLAASTWAVFAAWPLFDGNRRAYLLFAVLVLSGPFSFYFSTVLSEAMFFSLTVGVLAALKRGNVLLAGILAAALSATRIVGVFIVFAIVFDAYRRHRQAGGTPARFPRAVLENSDLLLAIVLAPLGLFCYMAFLHLWIGDALAFSHVQRAWAREIDDPLYYLWSALNHFPDPGSQDWFMPDQWLAFALVGGLVLTAVLFAQRRLGEAVFSTVALVLPLFTGVASMIRFVAALAPLYLLVARLLSRHPLLLVGGVLALLYLDYSVTIVWLGGYVALI